MAVLTGTTGADQLRGGDEADRIDGRTGPDTLAGRNGADTISAGGGGDLVRGGDGADVLYGHSRADRDPQSGVIQVEEVAADLDRPVFVTAAPGDSRLYVVESHTGEVEILDPQTGEVNATPFLQLRDGDISEGNEQGLLGLAFHPDYAANGRFYAHLTNADGDIEIREYIRSESDPDRADRDSGRVLLTIPHGEASNHNGGWIGFGPDGYLHIAIGDGGAGQSHNAQDTGSLLGKILRIDVNGDDFPGDDGRNYGIPQDNPFVGQPGADEIWAYGLRNPWRASFDRDTGDFYIGDVGQGSWEEVDLIAARSEGGQNFGWDLFEGDHPPSPDGFTGPIAEYAHQTGPFGGEAITGGYVYRGPGNDDGLYVFADFISDNLWTLKYDGAGAVDFENRNSQLRGDLEGFTNIASFGEGPDGTLYAVSLSGRIFRISPSAAAGDGADRLYGGDGEDRAYGGAGADRLYGEGGADILSGGIGADRLFGGDGADRLSGGAGRDRFVVQDNGDSALGGADRILDLESRDRIDLSRLDANEGAAGDQAFVRVADFTGEAGELRVRYAAGSDRTFIEGDTDGDGRVDLRITASGDQREFDGFVL
jgi:glucose/arabinose dehydrogenase